ncbi:MAG TPA: Crp/Fnr family transcriptional regulator [Burkholderiaceae bacterium]|nr:Crp/Fnr family transcriptional regulator [Burkholderiaceae bacterium]
MTWVDLVGYSAATASFVAFSAKTMIPLRVAAICSNVLFISFGLLSGFWPSALLHTLLLPLNIHRLLAMRRLVRRVAAAAHADFFEAEWLRPYMRPMSFTKGQPIFAKGEASHGVYFIVSGQVHFPEVGEQAGPGLMFGEIAVFTNEGRRTLSCVCDTDVEVLYMTNEELRELYFQNPEFGFHLVRLIVGRMKRQIDRMQDAGIRPAAA